MTGLPEGEAVGIRPFEERGRYWIEIRPLSSGYVNSRSRSATRGGLLIVEECQMEDLVAKKYHNFFWRTISQRMTNLVSLGIHSRKRVSGYSCRTYGYVLRMWKIRPMLQNVGLGEIVARLSWANRISFPSVHIVIPLIYIYIYFIFLALGLAPHASDTPMYSQL